MMRGGNLKLIYISCTDEKNEKIVSSGLSGVLCRSEHSAVQGAKTLTRLDVSLHVTFQNCLVLDTFRLSISFDFFWNIFLLVCH